MDQVFGSLPDLGGAYIVTDKLLDHMDGFTITIKNGISQEKFGNIVIPSVHHNTSVFSQYRYFLILAK